MKTKTFLWILAAFVLLLGTASAYIQTQSCGIIIAWASNKWPLSFVICSKDTTDVDVPEASKLALRLSFATWEDDSGSLIDFSEDTSASSQAINSYNPASGQSDASHHIVLFDKDNSSGYFPNGSGVVALTPIVFTVSASCPTGVIVDADILINSHGFTFSSSAADLSNGVDLQDVITHEIGHFIGLDHSAVGAATMFPFVDFGEVAKRSLSADDVAAAAVLRPPSSSSKGTIGGTIFKNNGSTPVSRPHVVALDANGNVASAIYGSTDGTFTLTGLSAGNYTVYATPYFGVLSSANIQDDTTVSTDISMTFYGGNASPTVFTLSASEVKAIGSLTSNAVLGSSLFTGPHSDAFPVIKGGSATAVTLTGTGFGGLTLEISNPLSADVTASGTSINGGGTSVGFDATAASNAAVGARDVRLASGNNKIVYPGILDIVDPAPTISSLDVAVGAAVGGTDVVINGTGFQGDTNTLKVIFEDTLATVNSVSATQISVTTPAHGSGTVSVGVINPDGQGALLLSAFVFDPAITSLSRSTVCFSAQTPLTINGAGFQSGATVLVGTTPATSVVVVSSSKITCKTPPLDEGVYDLTVTNPDLGTVTSVGALTYNKSCGGGGGGGCFSVKPVGPSSPTNIFGFFLPYLFLIVVMLLVKIRRAAWSSFRKSS